jgi:enoyl-CoA hydratase
MSAGNPPTHQPENASSRFTTLRCADVGPVLHVTLDNAPVNAMTQTMFSEIAEAFRGLATRDRVRAVALTADHRHFSAGGDISELRDIGAGGDARLKVIRDCYWAVLQCPVPVVAGIHGKALGGGAALASVCDILYCEPTAEVGLPELKVGVMGGAGHMMRILPQQVVRRMFLTGEPLSAQRLHELGAVTGIVTRDDLKETVVAEATRIAEFSSVAVRYAKQDLAIAEATQLPARYELEQLLTRELGNYADSYEAGTAFLERRAPIFLHDRSLRSATTPAPADEDRGSGNGDGDA